MKAYVVHVGQALAPFRKPASQLRFKEGTLSARLEGQLRKAGLEVVHSDGKPAPRSISISDDVVLSDSFLRRLIAAIPDPRRSYQVEVESGRFTLLASRGAPRLWKKLPIHYHGDDGGPPEPLRLQPEPVFEVDQGLPPRMHMLTDIRVFFFDIWAIRLEYWFDLQTASSLYCRELVAKLIGPFHGRVPAGILARV